MRYLTLFIVLILTPMAAKALEIEDRRWFGPDAAGTTLRVLSTADTSVFAPVIDAYLEEAQNVAIDYIVASSGDVMAAIETSDERFDMVISSAMNLQTKLANDGYALPHVTSVTDVMPDWAVWRGALFAFTREPAAMVISP